MIKIKLFVFVFIFSSRLNSQSDISLVQQNMEVQEQAWNEGNIQKFMDYYWKSDSLRFVGKRGITYGWKNTLDNYLKSYPDKKSMGVLHFKIEYTNQVSSETIFIIGKWELEKENPVGGYFSLLWKKINNNWVIVVDHTS